MACQEVGAGETAHHGEDSDPERQQGCHRRAKGQEQEEGHHRENDHLSAMQVTLRHVGEIMVERNHAGRHHVECARPHQRAE